MKKNPKRRKDKYNPYTITYKHTGIIKFKDNNGKDTIVEISQEIYEEFNKFELVDISQMNKYDRHIEHLELSENILNKRMVSKSVDVETMVINKLENQHLYNIIQNLSQHQKKRIILYFFEELTLKEISQKEKCSIRAIQYSLNCALKNLRKLLS